MPSPVGLRRIGRYDRAALLVPAYSFANAEASSFVARAIADGASDPTLAQKIALDSFVSSLKLGPTSGTNIYSKLLVVVPPVWHEDARQNLIADAFNPTILAGAPVFENFGRTFDAVDDVEDTNFNPFIAGTPFLQDSNSGGFYILSVVPGVTSSFFGWFDGTDGFSLGFATSGSSFRAGQAALSAATAAIADKTGMLAWDRSASNITKHYHKGVQRTVDNTPNQVSTALNNTNFVNNRVVGTGAIGHADAGYFLAGHLSSAEHFDIHTAWTTLLAGLA